MRNIQTKSKYQKEYTYDSLFDEFNHLLDQGMGDMLVGFNCLDPEGKEKFDEIKREGAVPHWRYNKDRFITLKESIDFLKEANFESKDDETHMTFFGVGGVHIFKIVDILIDDAIMLMLQYVDTK